MDRPSMKCYAYAELNFCLLLVSQLKLWLMLALRGIVGLKTYAAMPLVS